MSEQKHSPLPWIVFGGRRPGRKRISTIARSGSGLPFPISESVNSQDADFIVRVVNSHEELIQALEEIAKGQGAFNLDPLEHAKNSIENMKEIAQAALAKARGESQ